MSDIVTFGQVRKMIIDTIIELRDERIDPNRGMAIAANMKVLNDSVNTELQAAKVAMLAKERGYDFGRVMQLGTHLIGSPSAALEDQSSSQTN
jgi:hypothetical protein